MSWILSTLLFTGPVLHWGDSLYVDFPRIGAVQDFAYNGRSYHWVYREIAVYELNSEWRWCTGFVTISGKEQDAIQGVVEEAGIEKVESLDLEIVTHYWIGGRFYECQFYKGPWQEMDRLFSRLMPSYTVDVRDEPLGAGLKAVHGTLYCGEDMVFRSISGGYEAKAPPVSQEGLAYLDALAEKRSVALANLDVDGLLYLEDDSVLFFYVLEDS